MDMQPFTVQIPQATLDDLAARLARTRWPDEVEDAGWAYGVPLAYMRDLVAYWHAGFDWRAQERYINSFPHYHATVDGIGVHFIHARGHGPAPLPLLLTHGWPSSFYEFLPLIPYLTDPAHFGGDPADAFDVVIPSVPGHGFSDRPQRRGFEDRRVAALWVQLMQRLGYARFATHAYDLGASITGLLCLDYPEQVIGYHTTAPAMYLSGALPDATSAERSYLEVLAQWRQVEGGYAHIQGTRPQTLAYGLHDSPTGLAAWIVDKWYTWTAPPSGKLEQHFSPDALLANVMIYWVTETINAANRYYAEPVRLPAAEERVQVPLGVTLTATQPFDRPPREYVARRYANIQRWAEFGCGGHFIALEEPYHVAEAIRVFFRAWR